MQDLSTTAALNSPAGGDPVGTSLDNYLRSIQAVIRSTNAKGADIASASSIDLGAATGEFVTVTGTTTITSLGTVDAGIARTVHFSGALTITHNATSLILPGGRNIITVAGDVAQFRSLGSGNWRCVGLVRAGDGGVGAPITVETVAAMKALTGLVDGAVIKPWCISHIFENSELPDFIYSSSPATPNNVTTYSQDVGGGSFHAKYDGAVSVKWAGAKGDGATDDTAAFEAALAVILADGKGVLRIPSTPLGYLLNGGAASPDGYKNGLLVPFDAVNVDLSRTIQIKGDNGAKLLCGSDNMVLLRISRNCTRVENLTLDYNGKTGVILQGIIPEDMTQTTTLVSQSVVYLIDINRIGGPGVDGLVIQPGPRVLGADSGCFYHEIVRGSGNFVGGGRHVYLKKGPTWAIDQNRPTRTNFYGQRLFRGNTGYHFEVGTEISLVGCNEELINSGVTPLATPTARHVTSDCQNIRYFGGYSEACTRSTTTPAPIAGVPVVRSYGYAFNSGPDVNEWNNNADASGDAVGDFFNFTPVLVSSGGGTQGAGTITGYGRKLQGRMLFIQVVCSVAPGTLAAGNLSFTGLPFVPSPASQRLPAITFGGLTIAAGFNDTSGLLSGGSILLRKHSITGNADAPLTLAEVTGATLNMTLQGIYAY